MSEVHMYETFVGLSVQLENHMHFRSFPMQDQQSIARAEP